LAICRGGGVKRLTRRHSALASHDWRNGPPVQEAESLDDVLCISSSATSRRSTRFSTRARRRTPTGQAPGTDDPPAPSRQNLKSKAPLIVLIHGVHGDFTLHAHIVRELIEQGYVIIAPSGRPIRRRFSRIRRLRRRGPRM
jgi:predicted alpha/beta-fold hydrolase